MKANLPKNQKSQQKQGSIQSKLPKIPEDMQNMGKLAAFLQLICFLAIFIGIYLLLRQFVRSIPLRILILVADYFVTALISYLLIRPAVMKLDAKLKKK